MAQEIPPPALLLDGTPAKPCTCVLARCTIAGEFGFETRGTAVEEHEGVARSRGFLFASLLVMACPSPAFALSRIVADAPLATRLDEVREARAKGPLRTTTWLQAHVEGSHGHIAWLLTLPPTAALDLGATSFLDALEEATAPRVLVPATPVPPNRGCLLPSYPATITNGDAFAPSKPTAFATATSSGPIVSMLATQGIALDPQTIAALDDAGANAERLVALVFQVPAGDAWTAPLRIVAEGERPLAATDAAADVTDDALRAAWLVGPQRATLPATAETTLDMASIHWLSTSATDYADARATRLQSSDEPLALAELASASAFTSLTVLPDDTIVPSTVDAYLKRISARGESTADAATVANEVHAALAGTAPLDEPCPRGDLIPASFTCVPPGSASPAHALETSGIADDLAFALAGAPGRAWLTRVVALSALGGSPAVSDGASVDLARVPAASWNALCSASPSTGNQGGGSVSGGVVVAPGGSGDDGEGDISPGSDDGSGDDGSYESASVDVDVTTPVDDSSGCDANDSGGDDSGGCSCDGSSDEGGGDSGCSGGGADTGGGCSGGGGGGMDCTIGGESHGRRHVRIAKLGFVAIFAAFVLRRRTKKARAHMT